LSCIWFELEIGGRVVEWVAWVAFSLRKTHAQMYFPPEEHLLLLPQSFEIDNGGSGSNNNTKSNKFNLHT